MNYLFGLVIAVALVLGGLSMQAGDNVGYKETLMYRAILSYQQARAEGVDETMVCSVKSGTDCEYWKAISKVEYCALLPSQRIRVGCAAAIFNAYGLTGDEEQ